MEWNKTFIEKIGRQYAALVAIDDDGCFSKHGLAAELQQSMLLVVDIASQTLLLINRGQFISRYQVSTSLRGAGCRENSACTPLGWHRIESKIGDQEPVGSVFIGRQVRGKAENLCSDADDDLITSRILWLDGIQPGVNRGGSVDSYRRYIYIHGTAQEHLIGTAVSHGCIRMRNTEVIELFDLVQENSIVLITHNLADTFNSVNASPKPFNS